VKNEKTIQELTYVDLEAVIGSFGPFYVSLKKELTGGW